MLDKIKGGLLGLAIGDALGAPTEFMSPEEIREKHGRVISMIGGGIWDVEPGETTDDTAMTVAVAKGIIANSLDPIDEIGKEFLKWRDTKPKDIGITIRVAFSQYSGDWFQAAEKTHHQLGGKSAGNGTLMRCLPIAFAYSDPKMMEEITIRHSKMTHFDDLSAEACLIYNRIAWRLLQGEELKASIISEVKNTRYVLGLGQEPECPPDGFVVHSLRWVLYWLLTSNSFEEVVIGATNMGEDSDTIAAIAGGLKGIEVGYYQLPYEYKSKLLDRVKLEELSAVLCAIRDLDTVQLREEAGKFLRMIGDDTERLYALVEQKAGKEEQAGAVHSIRENLYIYRVGLQEDDSNFEKKHFKWRCIENRFNRSKRLVDLGAPTIIILNELNWLKTEIEHMNLLMQGVEPEYTEEQLEELRELAEFERTFRE